jgi:hypothetical protein
MRIEIMIHFGREAIAGRIAANLKPHITPSDEDSKSGLATKIVDY